MGSLVSNRVVAVAYDGLCTFEFGVACELFGLPRPELAHLDWYDFEVVSIDSGPLRLMGGATVQAATDIDRIATAGTVVLPGWRDPLETPPARLIDALLECHRLGGRIMSICSGVFVLAATGLLDGASATTHWRYTDQLSKAFPAIDVQPDVLYVDNGATLTSAGSAAGLDLGLHLIGRDHGADVANTVARRLVVSPHRSGGQAQYISTPVPEAPESSLADTLEWALGNLDRPLPVAELARRARMAPRTFARHFRRDTGITPHQWLTRQRVLRAQRLLETTDAPIDVVADQCGFGSAATLRLHFNRETQSTPTSYRATFRHV